MSTLALWLDELARNCDYVTIAVVWLALGLGLGIHIGFIWAQGRADREAARRRRNTPRSAIEGARWNP